MTENKLEQVEDETEENENDVSAPVYYEITSYGVDFDVDGIVRRMERGDILIPPFQRNFVWDISQSSRFIESLLLGLPVLGIFLAEEEYRFLVIDGQQRLKTLLFFYEGVFNPASEKKRQIFRLSGENIIDKYKGLRYKDLHVKDKRILDNTTIHATIVKRDFSSGNDKNIYHHLYERLQML